MGHFYNNGLHTSSKGITVDAIRVSGMHASPCTIEEDCKSGLISSVTSIATGIFTFQLTAPYPPKLVVCIPQLSASSETADILTARYVENSYNATTGQFTVVVSNDDDAGAPVASNPAPANELHVLMMFNRYTY